MRAARKIAFVLAVLLTISTEFSMLQVHGSKLRISAENKAEGTVSVDVRTESNRRLRIGVHGENSGKTYYFTYSKNDGEIEIPLMFGNDTYSISLYEEVGEKFYEMRDSYDVDLQLNDYNEVYLSSSVIVSWANAQKTIAKAAELTKNKKSDFEKFHAIYKYVTENISYDWYKTVDSGYRSDPDATLSGGSGICLDFAVLQAALLRSAGVKCKLVYGSAKDMEGLHSWNVVYFRGRWVIVDPTKDAQCYEARSTYKYAKLTKDYKATYTF